MADKVSYYNTLIFTIISGIISLILLFLVLSGVAKNYLLMVIVVEVGIFSVIGTCIFQIYRNASLIAILKNSGLVSISYDKCPDYFSKKLDNNSSAYCSNEYIYEDAGMNKYLVKVYPSDMSPPNLHDPTSLDKLVGTEQAPGGPIDKFYLDAITSNKNLKTNEEQCAVIFKDSTDPNVMSGYSKLPWTNVRSQCESYAM
jgi:hypothetical protein